MKQNVKMVTSPKYSFQNWNVVDYLKGHKKTIITIIGAGLGYIFTNNELIVTGSAFIFSGIIAAVEYYFKDVTK